MSDLQALQRELLERRVAYACFLLGMVRAEIPALSRQRRLQLAGVLGELLQAIEAADQAGAP